MFAEDPTLKRSPRYYEKQKRLLVKRHMSLANVQQMELDAEGDLDSNRPTKRLKGRHITKEELSQAFGEIDGVTYVPSQKGCVFTILYFGIYTKTVKRARDICRWPGPYFCCQGVHAQA